MREEKIRTKIKVLWVNQFKNERQTERVNFFFSAGFGVGQYPTELNMNG